MRNIKNKRYYQKIASPDIFIDQARSMEIKINEPQILCGVKHIICGLAY